METGDEGDAAVNGPIEVHRGGQLQPSWAVPIRAEAPAPPPPPDDRLDLRAIYFALRRQRHVILMTIAAFVVLAIAITSMQTPMYSASSRVVLNTGDDLVVGKKSDSDSDPSRAVASDVVDTEAEVIRSSELALSVARALNLDNNPRFSTAAAPRESKLHAALSAIGLARPAKPVDPSPKAAERAVVDKLLSSLSVERIGTTYAFNILIKMSNAVDAQAIANEYATQFTQLDLNRKRDNGSTAATFLSKRLEELRQQAQADTARVQQYRIANHLLSTTGASLSEQEISSYNEAATTARAQAAEDQARLATARAQLQAGSTGDDVGEALNSPVVSTLRTRRAEVSGRLASLEAQFGPLYPGVQKARSELQDIDSQITAEIKRVISNLEAKVRVSSGRLSSIQGSLGSAQGQLVSNNRAMVGLDDLTRRAEASQQLYDSYLAQYKQTVASQGTERPEARVISYADLPGSPISPKPILNVLLALVIGAGIGIVIALVREMLYSGLSTAADIENRLGIRCLGSVPALNSILPQEESPVAAIINEPESGFAEAFRGVRTSLQYALDGPRQVLMISSALPREGKTTVSACLARMAALNGEQVVLVDADPRHRGASRLVRGYGTRPGLIEVLRGEAPLDEALIQDQSSDAWILPIRGTTGRLGDLLIGEEMNQLIEALRARFSLVIFDSAPILPMADTRSLAAKMDAVVMVARWRATADHAVRNALRLLPHDLVPIAGVVLSQVDVRKQAKFGYGDTGFYYEQYRYYYQ